MNIRIFLVFGLAALITGCFEPDAAGIAYQGYFYQRAELHPDYGRVQVNLYPTAERNQETRILEYDSPYTLLINVWCHPDNLKGEYEGKEVVAVAAENIFVRSAEGQLLFEEAGGNFSRGMVILSYDWTTERQALDFERQDVIVEFTLLIEADGEVKRELVATDMASEFGRVLRGDLDAPW